jgi:hypothetical protein
MLKILHNDTVPADKALSVEQFLAQKLVTEMEYPPYSPDLVLNDVWLFPKIVWLRTKISGY